VDIFDRIIAGGISACIGAFSAYIFNKYNWKQQTLNDSILSMETDLLNSLESFLKNSVLYWSEDQINLDEKKFLEAKIKMTYMNLTPQFEQLAFTFGKFDSGSHLTITLAISSLFEEATGGDFESIRRIASSKRCTKIISLCNKIRAKIRKSIHS
jgi:hypothetical protein